MATYLVVHSDLSSPNNDVELVVMLAFCETLSLRSSISKTRTINCISEGGVNFLQLITSTCHDKLYKESDIPSSVSVEFTNEV